MLYQGLSITYHSCNHCNHMFKLLHQTKTGAYKMCNKPFNFYDGYSDIICEMCGHNIN